MTTKQDIIPATKPAEYLREEQILDEAIQQRNAIEQKRKEALMLKKATQRSRVTYELTSREDKKINIDRKLEYADDLSAKQQTQLVESEISAATASANREFSQILLSQTINAFQLTETYSPADAANAVSNTLLSLKPNDEYESMIISRTLVLHNQYMHCMMQAAQATTLDAKDKYFNFATKLMRVFNESLESLNRYRRRGESKVTVNHNHNYLNVNEGGKAVVNPQFTQPGGEGNDKK